MRTSFSSDPNSKLVTLSFQCDFHIAQLVMAFLDMCAGNYPKLELETLDAAGELLDALCEVNHLVAEGIGGTGREEDYVEAVVWSGLEDYVTFTRRHAYDALRKAPQETSEGGE